MQAICIDGYTTESTVRLPEGVPLEVYEVADEPDYYLVPGYESEPDQDGIIIWHKRRFIPLSNIDETELVNEKSVTHATVGV